MRFHICISMPANRKVFENCQRSHIFWFPITTTGFTLCIAFRLWYFFIFYFYLFLCFHIIVLCSFTCFVTYEQCVELV